MTETRGTLFGRAALRASSLFAGIDDAGLDVLTAGLRLRRFRPGETIFHREDPGDALHVVASGAVKIVLPSARGEESAIIATLGPGDFFGELALLDGAPRSATAVAVGRTETLVLRREVFQGLIDANQGLRRALLGSLAAEIRRLTGHVEDLHFLDLPARLARQLVRRSVGIAPAPDGSIHLAWPYTQADLAGMIGASRQSVNRLLADFADRGLIRLEKDALTIPDPDALAAVAES